MEGFKFDDKALQKLIDALKNDGSEARVGILGRTNARNDAGETNATIGARHEFGLGVPQRSFLRMPIEVRLQKEIKASGLITPKSIKEIIETGTLRPMLEKIAIVGERCVLLAFDSEGFGKWQKSNMEYKAVRLTLVETQQLRNSITSEVAG
jgi:hypothetical protein